MKVRFHPAARAELKRARAWYEERSPMSAAALAQEVDQAVSDCRNTDAVSSSGTWNEADGSPTVSLQHLLSSTHCRDRHRLGSSSQAEARLLAATLRCGLTMACSRRSARSWFRLIVGYGCAPLAAEAKAVMRTPETGASALQLNAGKSDEESSRSKAT